MIKALIGNGGHAREVLSQMSCDLVRFIDDIYWTPGDSMVLPLSEFDETKYTVMIAIGDSQQRHDIHKRLPKKTQFFSFVHPSSLIFGKDVEIGEGSFIGAYSQITTNIILGKHAILNRSNHIGHDSIIGDFFSAHPGSIVSGNCKIGNRVYLGTNSSIKENTIICDDVVIGLNSGVVCDIKEPGIYGGVPVKKLK